MKTTIIKSNISVMKVVAMLVVVTLTLTFSSCSDDDPQKEDVPELITKVTLTFTPAGGGTAVTASATDPDGEGVQDIQVDGPINLTAGVSYTLSLALINELAQPTDPEYNIADEVEEEGAEHMFFFSWTNNVFSSPAGDGNIDNRADEVNYLDEDENGFPLGLLTSWTAGTAGSGKFKVILKHQPELKTETSGATVGETDLDVEFDVNVN